MAYSSKFLKHTGKSNRNTDKEKKKERSSHLEGGKLNWNPRAKKTSLLASTSYLYGIDISVSWSTTQKKSSFIVFNSTDKSM